MKQDALSGHGSVLLLEYLIGIESTLQQGSSD